MKYEKIFLLAFLPALTLSCTKDQTAVNGSITEIAAALADSQSKTVLGSDGTSILWSPYDTISVFYNGDGVKFTSINSTPKDRTIFRSSYSLIYGGTETSSEPYIYAAYPYSSTNAQEGDIITLTVPKSQTAVEGSFGCGAFPSVGRSKDTNIAFYNVCGGVCFSVSTSGVKRVVFSGRNNEKLAGRVQVSFDGEGKPVVVSVPAGEEEIRIDAPDGGEFTPGTLYYLSILPSTLSEGFRMVFYTDSKHATLERTSSAEVKRSVFGLLKNADSGLVYEDGGLVEGRIFTASLYPGSKTSIDSETGILSWDKGQRIFLSDGDSTDTPVISKITDQLCTFTTKKMKSPTVFGGIPHKYYSLKSGVSCTIPTVQDGTFNGACVMLAKTDLSNSLEFAAASAVLKLTLAEEVDSIRFIASESAYIAGTCTVDMSGEPTLELNPLYSSETIIAKPYSKRSVFYFGILPCTTKISLEIYKDGGVAYKSSSSNVTFTKGKILSMNISTKLNYSVDMGLSVKWATCNIGASARPSVLSQNKLLRNLPELKFPLSSFQRFTSSRRRPYSCFKVI